MPLIRSKNCAKLYVFKYFFYLGLMSFGSRIDTRFTIHRDNDRVIVVNPTEDPPKMTGFKTVVSSGNRGGKKMSILCL